MSSRPVDARAGLEIHTLSYPSPARRDWELTRQETAAVVVGERKQLYSLEMVTTNGDRVECVHDTVVECTGIGVLRPFLRHITWPSSPEHRYKYSSPNDYSSTK